MCETRNSSMLAKISVLVVICFCCLPAKAKYGGGTGEPNDPYQIRDANHMQAIGADANDWYKCFKLMADVDLGQFTEGEFNIIGYYHGPGDYNPFAGIFDGNGHTISNFTYNSNGVNYIGLFGCVSGGGIKNLGLINPSVNAVKGSYVGVLVGRFLNGTLTKCYLEGGSVKGRNSVGGLVGSSVVSTINNCFSTGSVSGVHKVGGLAGYGYRGTITNSYSTGSVSGTVWAVGGLVGYHWEHSITNSYSTGSVSGNLDVGGLVGLHREGQVTSSYWDTQTSGCSTSAGGTGKTTAEMQTASTFIAWGCEPVWTIDEGVDYPRLVWENKPGELMINPSYGGGSGEPNDPYLIYTAEQLNTIGLIPCDWDKCFKLMADVDLGQFTGREFNIIGYYHGNEDDKPFTGIFDGNGHTISNFTYDSNEVNYIGLLGYVRGGDIKNLGLINPDVNAGTGSYVGVLGGYVVNGNMTKSYVEGGSVKGKNNVGGLAGSSVASTINNCFSAGSVTGASSVGSLVGSNWGTLDNCYATCSVSGRNYVGGLVGLNGDTTTNSYSTGSVLGEFCVGGLVGRNGWCFFRAGCVWGTVSNCYSSGSVVGDEYAGGLVGSNLYYSTVSHSFWDIETSGQATSDGGTGLPTAEMQMASTFIDAGWDFNTPIWTIDEGVDYPRLWWETVPVLHAEPEVTLGTSNIISWGPLPSANEYYAECAEDANFTSIIYNSGWITETSCEFTGLQLGQRYWYSVKARNAEGVESQWSNVESSLQGTLTDAVEAMLEPESLKNENMKKALLNKIDAALKMIEEANYTGALSKLRNDILAKMDGCGETGQPDKNDWIITCEEQNEQYPLVMETIEHVRSLME